MEGCGLREEDAETEGTEETVGVREEEGEGAGERELDALLEATSDGAEERLVEAHLLTTALAVGVKEGLLLAVPRAALPVGSPTEPVGTTDGVCVVVVEREEEGVTPPLTVAPVPVTMGLPVDTGDVEGVRVPKAGDREGELEVLLVREAFKEVRGEKEAKGVAVPAEEREIDAVGEALETLLRVGWVVGEGRGALETVPVVVGVEERDTTGVVQGLGDPVAHPLPVPMDTVGLLEEVRVPEGVTEGERLTLGVGQGLGGVYKQ